MRSTVRFPTVFSLGLVLCLALPGVSGGGDGRAWGAPKKAVKNAKEISSTDDALQKQMDWESKILGPNTEKKIDLVKIQKLQAEETARREKQDKVDKAEKDRRDREAAATAAAQRNVHAPSSREMPEIQEAPPPPKPAEKHDDAFVDKLLKEKSMPKKKVAATDDAVDELLRQAKQEKPAVVAGKGKGGKGADTVDQLLATADKQPTIKTTTKRPVANDEPVSAEAAAREAAMKAIAAASAKADEDRNRNRKPVIPDAAILRARAEANARANPPMAKAAPTTSTKPGKSDWNDPFAADSDAPSTSKRSKVQTSVRPLPSESAEPSAPSTKRGGSRSGGAADWKDPFDAGGSPAPRARPAAPAKAAPAAKPKHPANWKDPFA